MSNPITPLDPKQIEKQEAQAAKEGYIDRDLIAIDMLGNVLTGGKPDETISSRSARAAEAGNKFGIVMSKFLNLFQKDHGAKAQAGDVERAAAVEKIEISSPGLGGR